MFNTCCCSFHYFHIRLEPKPCSSRKRYCVWCIFSVFSFDNFSVFVARCDHHCVVECIRFGVLLDNTSVSIVCKTMFMYFKPKSSCISNPTNTILRWFKTLKYPHVNTEQRMLCELNILCLLFGVLNAIQYPTEYVLEQKNQWKKNQTRKEKKKSEQKSYSSKTFRWILWPFVTTYSWSTRHNFSFIVGFFPTLFFLVLTIDLLDRQTIAEQNNVNATALIQSQCCLPFKQLRISRRNSYRFIFRVHRHFQTQSTYVTAEILSSLLNLVIHIFRVKKLNQI